MTNIINIFDNLNNIVRSNDLTNEEKLLIKKKFNELNKYMSRIFTTSKNATIKTCYQCKQIILSSNEHYACMCISCGNLNYEKRIITKSLDNKIAIVTGGRVKIGFETALKLLRSNCKVIVTSRFFKDTLTRYMKEADYNNWKDKLIIYRLDLLNYSSVLEFINFIKTNYLQIDYLINNAAQTLARPTDFYRREIDNDIEYLIEYNKNLTGNNKALITAKDNVLCKEQIYNTIPSVKKNYITVIPTDLPNSLDIYGQQLDMRKINSWRTKLENVNVQELLECISINTIMPFILIQQLTCLLKRENSDEYSYIINVTSMEGIFNYQQKDCYHPHTNMAKAALNMLTRTSGYDYKKNHNIIMCCVDTGWNNPQTPNSYNETTPLDCVDGAARILDPIYSNLKHPGVAYKNYNIMSW